MSYDFELFRPSSGQRPPASDEDGIESGVRDTARESAKRRLADLLTAHDPSLQETAFDYDEISKLHKIRVEEAYERCRRLELNDESQGGSGVQITLYDDSAAVTIPFWHEGDAARRNLERVWRYLDIICEAGGFEVFDAQLDRVIERGAFEDVVASYVSAMRRVSGKVAPRRAWWTFWRGGR